MSVDVFDPDDATTEGRVPDRYAAIETPEGDLVVFDSLESDAWIQSTAATSLPNLE